MSNHTDSSHTSRHSFLPFDSEKSDAFLQKLNRIGRSRLSLTPQSLELLPLYPEEELRPTKIRCIEITTIGHKNKQLCIEDLETLFTSLHSLGQRIVILLKNKPSHMSLIVGIVSHQPDDPPDLPMEECCHILTAQIQSTLPGSRTWPETRTLLDQLGQSHHMGAILGNPSLPKPDQNPLSAIESMLISMAHESFSVLIVADPLDSGELDLELEQTQRGLQQRQKEADSTWITTFETQKVQQQTKQNQSEKGTSAQSTRSKNHENTHVHKKASQHQGHFKAAAGVKGTVGGNLKIGGIGIGTETYGHTEAGYEYTYQKGKE